MSENNKYTELSELGEFGLIKHLTKDIKLKHSSSVKGVGDDAAILNYKDKHIVVTTDLLTEGIHFDLMYTPLKHLGYKSVVVNLSDVYAMNAIPKQITFSLAVSSKFSLEHIEELYEGIKLACERYNIDLVGGDTSSSASGLIITVTAIGEANIEDIVRRDTAKENDLLCVSGDLGAAYMGLQLLEREKKLFNAEPTIQPDLSGYDYIIERQLKPEAREDVVKLFKELNVKPTSMIDISDGLSSEALHICEDSEVGCRIYEDKIPVNEQTQKMADEFNLIPTIPAMNGGEDYELLFTISQNDYDKLKNNPTISVISHITDKKAGSYLISRDGKEIQIQAQGWNTLNE